MKAYIYLDITKRSLFHGQTDFDNIQACKMLLDYCVFLLKQNNVESTHVLDSYIKSINLRDVDNRDTEKIKGAVVPEIQSSDVVCYLDFDALGELTGVDENFRKIVVENFKPLRPMSLLLQGKSAVSKVVGFYIQKKAENERKAQEKKEIVRTFHEKRDKLKDKTKKKDKKKEIDICR